MCYLLGQAVFAVCHEGFKSGNWIFVCRWLAQLLVNVGFPDAAATLTNEIVTPTPLTTT